MLTIGSTAKVGSVSITNDVGGTKILPKGRYTVQVLRGMFDYEVGDRYVGRLLESKDVEAARAAGTTGFEPSSYRKYGEPMVRETEAAQKAFDPSKVFFSEHDIINRVQFGV